LRDLPAPTPKLPGVLTVDEFAAIVRRHVPEDAVRVVVDLGAMDGGDTLALKAAFPNARVIAIEALRENFDRYLSWLPGIEAHCTVIAERDGTAPFFEKSVNGVHGLFERASDDTIAVRSVATETLTTFCRRAGIAAIDLLKIDVEGATLEVLEGFRKGLDRVAALHVESEEVAFFRGQRLDPEVTEMLSSAGFSQVARTERQAVTGEIVGRQFDSVWVARRFLPPPAEPGS
jgi:FkbM family methyltransferase